MIGHGTRRNVDIRLFKAFFLVIFDLLWVLIITSLFQKVFRNILNFLWLFSYYLWENKRFLILYSKRRVIGLLITPFENFYVWLLNGVIYFVFLLNGRVLDVEIIICFGNLVLLRAFSLVALLYYFIDIQIICDDMFMFLSLILHLFDVFQWGMALKNVLNYYEWLINHILQLFFVEVLFPDSKVLI